MSIPTNPWTPQPPKPVTGKLHLAESDQLGIYLTDRDYGPAVEVDAETRARWQRIAAEFDAWQEELREVYDRARERDRLLAERAKAERVLVEAQEYVRQRIEALVEFERGEVVTIHSDLRAKIREAVRVTEGTGIGLDDVADAVMEVLYDEGVIEPDYMRPPHTVTLSAADIVPIDEPEPGVEVHLPERNHRAPIPAVATFDITADLNEYQPKHRGDRS